MSEHVTVTIDRDSEVGRAVSQAINTNVVLAVDGQRFHVVAEGAAPRSNAFRDAIRAIGPLWSEHEADRLKAAVQESRNLDIVQVDRE